MTTALPTALLVLGAQRHLLDAPGPLPDPEALLARLRPLVDRARRGGAFVVYAQRDGPPGTPNEPFGKGWTLHNDFRVEHGDLLLRVTQGDAFAGSQLDGELHTRAARRLILCGAPSRDLLATARGAHEHGFEVLLARDAHQDPDPALTERANAELVGAAVDELYPEGEDPSLS